MLFNALTVKVIAVLLGPSGVGIFSIIRQSILTFAFIGQGGQTALVQGVADKKDLERDIYLKSILFVFLFGSFITVLVLELLSPQIAKLLFGEKSSEFEVVVRWIALPVFLSNAYIYLKSVLSGFGAVTKIAVIEVIGPVVMLCLIYPVSILVGGGKAVALVWMISSSQFAMICFYLYIVYSERWFKKIHIFDGFRINIDSFNYFAKMSFVIMATSLVGTFSIFLLRVLIVRKSGMESAGIFDAAWALSGNYVMVILSSFSIYFMPTLTKIKGVEEKGEFILKVTRVTIWVMVPLILSVILLKPFLIKLLYSDKFFGSLQLIRWLVIADYLKITVWILGTALLAKKHLKVYFWTELLWYSGLVLISWLTSNFIDLLQAIGIAMIAVYSCLVIYLYTYIQKIYQINLKLKIVASWFIGLLIIILATLVNWNVNFVDIFSCFAWSVLAIAFIWMTLEYKEKRLVLRALRINSK